LEVCVSVDDEYISAQLAGLPVAYSMAVMVIKSIEDELTLEEVVT
jgi:hypothetical protein